MTDSKSVTDVIFGQSRLPLQLLRYPAPQITMTRGCSKTISGKGPSYGRGLFSASKAHRTTLKTEIIAILSVLYFYV